MTVAEVSSIHILLGVGAVMERDGQYLLGLRRGAIGHGVVLTVTGVVVHQNLFFCQCLSTDLGA